MNKAEATHMKYIMQRTNKFLGVCEKTVQDYKDRVRM